MPIALGTTKISENMIAASKGKRFNGCRVTSDASSGFSQTSKKLCYFRTSRNSGKYLPAYRIIHIGGGVSDSPLRTLRIELFFIGGNSAFNFLCASRISLTLVAVSWSSACNTGLMRGS